MNRLTADELQMLAHLAATIAAGFVASVADHRARPSNTTIARSSVEIARSIVRELTVSGATGEQPDNRRSTK